MHPTPQPRRRSARMMPPPAAPHPQPALTDDNPDAKRTRAASQQPPPPQEQLAPPPPPDAAAEDNADATRPPQPPPLIFDLLFFTGCLDAVSLTVLACCSRDLRKATTAFWAGVRSNNPVTRLKSAALAAGAKRPPPPPALAPIAKAGQCVACRESTTRFSHPISGHHLCPRCGREAETAHCWSPLYEHRMIDENEAKKRHCLDPASGGDALAELLPFARRRGTTTVTYASAGGGPDVRTVSFTKYAPHYAADAKEALFSFPRPVGGGGGGGSVVVNEDSAGDEARPGEARRVFSRRDVAALVLERFGGPKLLQERVRHLELGYLQLQRPDE